MKTYQSRAHYPKQMSLVQFLMQRLRFSGPQNRKNRGRRKLRPRHSDVETIDPRNSEDHPGFSKFRFVGCGVIFLVFALPASFSAQQSVAPRFVDLFLMIAPEYPCTWPDGFPTFRIDHYLTIGPRIQQRVDNQRGSDPGEFLLPVRSREDPRLSRRPGTCHCVVLKSSQKY